MTDPVMLLSSTLRRYLPNPALILPDRLLWVAGLLYGLLAALYLVPVLPPELMRDIDGVYAETLLLSVTMVLFVTAARRGRDAAVRRFWWLLSASFGFWWLAHLLGYALRADSGGIFNFVKDLLFLTHSCLVVVAADLRPGMLRSPLQAMRARLAAVSSVVVIVGIFGYTALVPALTGIAAYESPFLVYAVLDAYIAARFLTQGSLLASRSWRLLLLLVGASFLLIVVADLLVLAYEHGVIAYRPGQPLNLAWFLFYLPLFVASRVTASTGLAEPRRAPGDSGPALNLTPVLAYAIAVPLIHLAGYGFGWLDPGSRGVRDLFMLAWIATAAMALLWQYDLLRRRILRMSAERAAAQAEADRLQDQVRQSQRIDMAGQLSGGLAHEFGNSLFGAESLAQRMLTDVQKSGTIERQHAESLVDALAGSRELVRKLNYLGSGNEPESSVVNLVDEVRDTIRLARPGISKDIRISFHSDMEDISAIARPQDLQQITMNLVLNARDSIGERGFIDIHVGSTSPSFDSCSSCGAMITGAWVWLRVSDSGPGVPEQLRRHVFEPLVSGKPQGQGSGLGLSIVHALVHQLRGHIVLGEMRQAHCSFTILLPAIHLDVSGKLQQPPAAAGRVLIVEGDEVLARAFRDCAALHGLHVNRVTSTDAAEVILRQPERRPDTVIVGNLHNPLDVVAVIEAANRLEGCRVLLSTRRPQRLVLESVEGIDAVVDQPASPAALAAAVLDRPD